MKKFLLCLILIITLSIPVKANITAQTTNGIITVTWLWISTPGVYPGGFWTPISVE